MVPHSLHNLQLVNIVIEYMFMLKIFFKMSPAKIFFLNQFVFDFIRPTDFVQFKQRDLTSF